MVKLGVIYYMTVTGLFSETRGTCFKLDPVNNLNVRNVFGKLGVSLDHE